MDFTLYNYKLLIQSFISKGYSFILFRDYNNSIQNNGSYIFLRHDVDRLPQNSLRTAEIENSLGIRGSYYFRIVSESYDEEIIKKIAKLGHEIGYHYEDIDLIRKNIKINTKKHQEMLLDLAYESFCNNLEKMRKIYPVKTICAHGSPLSPYDNKMIWDKYNYKKLGIIGEPSFDIDWNKFAYFTDTGRRWNGTNVSVRDRVNSNYNYNFKCTTDIVKNLDKLPGHLMITVHPQRWNNNILIWTKELVAQSGKNLIKKYLYVKIYGQKS